MEYDHSSINLLRPAIVFVPNRGQAAGSARFTARAPGQNLYFHEDGLTAVLFSSGKNTPDQQATIKGTVVKLTFLGAFPAEPQALQPMAGQFHYFRGNDPANWRTHIPSYKQLRYANLWDGVDLTLAGGEGGLKFLWSLHKASNFGTIRIRYEGTEEMRIAKDGSLTIRHMLGEMIDPAPIAWQEISGEKKSVACAYALAGNTVSFTISGAYDANAPLTIDPVLSYATFLGGSGYDAGYSIAADAQGCTYVGGVTASLNFPVTPGAFQTTFAGVSAAFLTKFAADGKTLVYSTYLGGGSINRTVCLSIALDNALCTYLTGYTDSSEFPVTPGAFQTTRGGNFDAFVTKVSADGASLVYSTFLGGSYLEYGYGIAVDAQGCAYAAGMTASSDFPVTSGAFQSALSGSAAAYLTKISPDGASLAYSTYFGGSASVWANDVAIDTQLCAYITGYTTSANMPVTPGAYQSVYGGGERDTFVTKFTADGTALVYSTFLGGSAYDEGNSIAVDALNIAHIAGFTNASDFPVTPGAFQTTYGGGTYDAFVTKLSPDGGSLMASTYLGGSDIDLAKGVALDLHSNVYVTGNTNSPNFPITPQVAASSLHGDLDAFVSILSPDLSRLRVSFYLGGSVGTNAGNSIALGENGAVYVTGSTSSLDFPVSPGAYQTANAGDWDAFAARAGFVLLKKASIVLQGLC